MSDPGHPPEVVRHNHATTSIRPHGECAACDAIHARRPGRFDSEVVVRYGDRFLLPTEQSDEPSAVDS